ncbi:MAG: hypothetical protein EOO88_30780 [Pedobacter sp.]|nr:MAG: hypothetical protein EOO88_30780 [Pedobacter sp.]
MVSFTKPPLSPSEMVDLFIKRGMIVPDRGKAERCLKDIGYYRLKGYARVVCEDQVTHHLVAGTTFDDVLRFYTFDRKLRLLTMDAVERIEVALKANMYTLMGDDTKDPFWYINPFYFQNKERHDEFMESCIKAFEKSEDDFIVNFKRKHPEHSLPPCWMMFEILTLGPISKAYKNLTQENQNKVTAGYSVHRSILESWFQAIHIVRNICAHHSPLYNRMMPRHNVIIKGPRGRAFKKVDNVSFASRALIMVILLEIIAPGSEWRMKLLDLFAKFPQIDLIDLGFNEDPASLFNLACPPQVTPTA